MATDATETKKTQLDQSHWRVIRRLHVAGGRAEWHAVRPDTRGGTAKLANLLMWGLVELDNKADPPKGPDWNGTIKLTPRGKAAQEFGEYES